MSIEAVKTNYQNSNYFPKEKIASAKADKSPESSKKKKSDAALWYAIEALAVIGIGAYILTRGKGKATLNTSKGTTSTLPKNSGTAQRATTTISDFSSVSADKITEALADENFRINANTLKEIQKNGNIKLKPSSTDNLSGVFKNQDGSVELYQNGVKRKFYKLNADNSYTYKIFDESGNETLSAVDVTNCSGGLSLV